LAERRKFSREFKLEAGSASPGHGVMKPEQHEIERLRRELARMKAERNILKNAAAYDATTLALTLELVSDVWSERTQRRDRSARGR
jgi:transposase-like protein